VSMSMNIHNVAKVELSEIKTYYLADGTAFYSRTINFTDPKGQVTLSIEQFSDNGYTLLIADTELAEMNAELPLLKAA